VKTRPLLAVKLKENTRRAETPPLRPNRVPRGARGQTEDRRWHLTNHDPLTDPIRTARQVAEITRLSKTAVLAIEKRALAKIRAALEKDFTDRKRRDELAQIDEG
jgi:hypothetical protein